MKLSQENITIAQVKRRRESRSRWHLASFPLKIAVNKYGVRCYNTNRKPEEDFIKVD